jgi:alkylation response protein AidB-like acyl-CoA dehydrogenase
VGEVKGYDKKAAPPSWTDISLVPYAEIDMDASPYHNDTHKRFRQVVRKFLWEQGVYDWSDAVEMSGEYPTRELFKKHGQCGMLALFAGRGPHLNLIPEPNLWSMAGMKPEQVDLFHMAILTEERARMVTPGAEDGIASGVSIGLGPVIHFGQEWTKKEIVQQVLMGEKIICLAITEPYAGSDVAGILTTARQATVDGEEGFIVRGTKKWSTSRSRARARRFADVLWGQSPTPRLPITTRRWSRRCRAREKIWVIPCWSFLARSKP